MNTLRVEVSHSRKYLPLWYCLRGAGAENAGVENVGVENAGVDSRGIANDELSR